MSSTGLSPGFGSIGFTPPGTMSSPDILSPMTPNSTGDHRYGYGSHLSPMGPGPRTSNPFARQGALENSMSMHRGQPSRPLQPLQLRETMNRSRSDLNSPLRSSMSWKGDAIDYSTYHHGAGGSPQLSGRQQSVYQPEQMSGPSSSGLPYESSSYSSTLSTGHLIETRVTNPERRQQLTSRHELLELPRRPTKPPPRPRLIRNPRPRPPQPVPLRWLRPAPWPLPGPSRHLGPVRLHLQLALGPAHRARRLLPAPHARRPTRRCPGLFDAADERAHRSAQRFLAGLPRQHEHLQLEDAHARHLWRRRPDAASSAPWCPQWRVRTAAAAAASTSPRTTAWRRRVRTRIRCAEEEEKLLKRSTGRTWTRTRTAGVREHSIKKEKETKKKKHTNFI